MNKRFTLMTFALVVLIFGISSCASLSKPNRVSYVTKYRQAEIDLSNSHIATNELTAELVEQQFSSVMSNLKQPDLSARIASVYADEFFFNDTLHTYYALEPLTQYLLRTSENLHSIDVDIDDIALNDKHAYVRWSMRYQIDADTESLESVGMTHLQFNNDGEIVLHQDYWDSYEGFYRTIPGVSFLIRQVKKRL